jgi:heme/copper-type cytochrome/quinol oxidase subunit 2
MNLSKILLTISIFLYGFVPPFIDLNKTHATNPNWVGHARFHVVWQVFITFFIAITALYILWFSEIENGLKHNLVLCLSLCVLGAFFLNIAFKNLYGGTLADPDGITPIGEINANVISFSFAFIMLIIGYYLGR